MKFQILSILIVGYELSLIDAEEIFIKPCHQNNAEKVFTSLYIMKNYFKWIFNKNETSRLMINGTRCNIADLDAIISKYNSRKYENVEQYINNNYTFATNACKSRPSFYIDDLYNSTRVLYEEKKCYRPQHFGLSVNNYKPKRKYQNFTKLLLTIEQQSKCKLIWIRITKLLLGQFRWVLYKVIGCAPTIRLSSNINGTFCNQTEMIEKTRDFFQTVHLSPFGWLNSPAPSAFDTAFCNIFHYRDVKRLFNQLRMFRKCKNLPTFSNPIEFRLNNFEFTGTYCSNVSTVDYMKIVVGKEFFQSFTNALKYCENEIRGLIWNCLSYCGQLFWNEDFARTQKYSFEEVKNSYDAQTTCVLPKTSSIDMFMKFILKIEVCLNDEFKENLKKYVKIENGTCSLTRNENNISPNIECLKC